jgi:hypothetical protein
MKPTKILIITTAVLLILSMHFYLDWKYNPLRKATESEKLNFKLYGNFYHGRIDKISASINSVLYNSNLVKSSDVEGSNINENKKDISTNQNTEVEKNNCNCTDSDASILATQIESDFRQKQNQLESQYARVMSTESIEMRDNCTWVATFKISWPFGNTDGAHPDEFITKRFACDGKEMYIQ